MFRKKKKTDSGILPNPYGFSLRSLPETTDNSRALICALKGLFIFAAVYGTIGGLISSFSLPCHMTVIALLLLFFSMLMAFLHYDRLLFNLCYPVVFLIFSYSIFTYRYQVNSGFQAFLSILQEEYSTYYDLSILRQAREYYTDRTMTITFAAVFIGFFLIVLLNIAVSEYMSLPLVFLLTFPIFQLGIFIRKMPDLPYLILLLFSYFMVAFLKRSGHFLFPYREKKKTDFSYQKTKNGICYRYHVNGKIMLELTGLLFAFSLIAGLLALPFLSSGQITGLQSATRRTVDQYVKIFTQNGLMGFFNRYEASGGLSEGKLGGVASVRPDYETDLTITFVPFSSETLYLRAFIGGNYTGSSWNPPDYNIEPLQKQLGSRYEDYENFTGFLEARRLQHYMQTTPNAGIYGKFEVKNIDANENYLYLPYYTDDTLSVPYTVSRGTLHASLPEGSSFQGNYYPLLHDYWNIPTQPDALLSSLPEDSDEAEFISWYQVMNTSGYTDVPYRLKEELAQLHDEIGYGAVVDDYITLIRDYLDENYTYSMTPGATPLNEDFALYFLKEQKTGYCSHFATAATLLLRSYGIPARYVEGYAVSFSEIADGTAVDASYDEWFTGDNPIGQTGVVSVNITDADAHAWVEVYKEGIGWVPYDFTPADDETPEQNSLYSDFFALFSGIFTPGAGDPDTPESISQKQINDGENSRFTSSAGFLMRPLLLFGGCLLLAIVVFGSARLLCRRLSLLLAYRRGNYGLLLSFHYRKLQTVLQRKGLTGSGCLLPSDLAKLSENIAAYSPESRYSPESAFSPASAFSPETVQAQMLLLERCLYAEHGITKKEADDLLLFLKKYTKLMIHCTRHAGDE